LMGSRRRRWLPPDLQLFDGGGSEGVAAQQDALARSRLPLGELGDVVVLPDPLVPTNRITGRRGVRTRLRGRNGQEFGDARRPGGGMASAVAAPDGEIPRTDSMTARWRLAKSEAEQSLLEFVQARLVATLPVKAPHLADRLSGLAEP